jgi:D-serine deaminase-like pyridoxal phosphate-dependent protein
VAVSQTRRPTKHMTVPMYALRHPETVPSPALLFYPELIRKNIERALEIAGAPERLRPHVKTHKTREIVGLEVERGIGKHKCATLAEAAMLAECGAPDVLIAYPLVGPNIARLSQLVEKYPSTHFAVIADHAAPVRALANALAARRRTVDVLLDINVGQDRTGIALGPDARALYEMIATLPGLVPGGLHVYDGHNRQEDALARRQAVESLIGPVRAFRADLEHRGFPVPRLVLGGTPTFAIHAQLDDPGIECSPGTMVLHDVGYGERFPDIAGFTPAAVVFTRVVSRPTAHRITFDVGTKAIAADPPAGGRCRLVDLPQAREVAHNEEHLVVELADAARFQPGDHTFALPMHICPTVALYPRALIIENGRIAGEWAVAARNRE